MTIRTMPARKFVVGLSLVAAGLVAGGTAAVVTTANAADSGTVVTAASAPNASGKNNPDETALTGDTLAKVKAAVLAKYPNATFVRVETDSDGVYEAHITTAAGENVTVELDKSYAVTGTEAGGGHRGAGPRGGGGAGETALTGETLAKVKATVLAKYPNATFVRVETDSDGVYEAHITTAAGENVTVELSKDYALTGTE